MRWHRVNRNLPCPVCHREDWCLVSPDRRAVICPRTESARYIEGSGYFHLLRPDRAWLRENLHQLQHRRATGQDEPLPEHNDVMARLMEQFTLCTKEGLLLRHAHELGVTLASLKALRAGIKREGNATAFPMTRWENRIVGIRFRDLHGRKWAAKGSRNGLFLPSTFDPTRTITIVEGPTDTAAALDMGLNPIGLPSVIAPWRLIAEITLGRNVLFVLDCDGRDSPASDHAARLAMRIALYARELRCICCPAKDMREWMISHGATKSDLAALAMCSKPVKPPPDETIRTADIEELLDSIYGVDSKPQQDIAKEVIENLELVPCPDGGLEVVFRH